MPPVSQKPVSGESFAGRVLLALETEAFALRRAETAASLADSVLTVAESLLEENPGSPGAKTIPGAGLIPGAGAGEPADPKLQAQVRLLLERATFDGRPMFDGGFSLRVGGGRLDLPDLAASPPSREALALAHRGVVEFKTDTLADRLAVVEAAIHTTSLTRPIIEQETPTPSPPRGRFVDPRRLNRSASPPPAQCENQVCFNRAGILPAVRAQPEDVRRTTSRLALRTNGGLEARPTERVDVIA